MPNVIYIYVLNLCFTVIKTVDLGDFDAFINTMNMDCSMSIVV